MHRQQQQQAFAVEMETVLIQHTPGYLPLEVTPWEAIVNTAPKTHESRRTSDLFPILGKKKDSMYSENATAIEQSRRLSLSIFGVVEWRPSSQSSFKSHRGGSPSPRDDNQQRAKSVDFTLQDNYYGSRQKFLAHQDQRRASAPAKLAEDCSESASNSKTTEKRKISSLRYVSTMVRTLIRKSLHLEKQKEPEEPSWTRQYTLSLPPHISRDASELDYLRRKYSKFIYLYITWTSRH